MSAAVAAKLATRASRRPRTRSTSRRATWVETTRSVGAWNVPTFSAREWRSAALETDGAKGSWTWQRSSAASTKSCSTVRATSIGSAARRRAVPGPPGPGIASPTASRRGGAPGSGTACPARIAARPSRTRSWDSDGATMTTACPRAARRSLVAWTARLTSWRDSQA